MSSAVEDVFTSLGTFLNANISSLGNRIIAGFPDERADAQQDRTYPYGTLILYDAIVARDEQTGLPTFVVKDESAGNCERFKSPNPVRLYFQFDTWCIKRSGTGGDWEVASELYALFSSRHTKVTTTDGRILFLVTEQIGSLDELAPDNVFRKDVRFSVVVWFDHPDDATTEYLVTQLKLTGNNEVQILIDET